ncbi:MAG: hypothetical protein HY928_05095 [Elusimicrobia bacterium]|nr:hypothetical protein [Elusimicrobiota bacterium]
MMTDRHGLAPAFLGFALALTGCAPKATVRAALLPQTLQQTDLNLTVTVVDDATGLPIPGAWVFASAEIITEPPVDRFGVVGANRGQTGSGGSVSFPHAQGMYRPLAPEGDPLWRLVDEKQAKLRRPKYIAGGSIVVAAAQYGVVHQPFAIEDSPAYRDWLKDNPGQDYGGLLGLKTAPNRKALFLKSEEFLRGTNITLRMKRGTPGDLATQFRWTPFVSATWEATSVKTGGSEDLQVEVYKFFAQQMRAAAEETADPYDKAMFDAYYHPKAIDHYIDANRSLGPQDQPGAIQLWLVQKALEVQSQELTEAREYIQSIRKGVADEGRHPTWQNHFLDPKDPARGLPTFDSALRWAGLDADHAKNEWDWTDAQRYYQTDKMKAYEALGRVLRVLTNLSVPKYTELDQTQRTAFEAAVEQELRANLGSLPPDYWRSVNGPAFAMTPRARFEAVAQGTGKAGGGRLEARGPITAATAMTDAGAGDGALDAAKATFPLAIAQAAGLLTDFHKLMYRPKFVQAFGPGNGNGNGGPQAVQQSSGTATSATDAENSNAQSLTPRPGTQGTEEAKHSDRTRRQKRHKRLSGVSGSRKIDVSPKKVTTGIDSGLVVAYGHLIRPPFSVEWQDETLSVNGIQVSPSIVLKRSSNGVVPAASEKDRREFQQRADLVGEARKIYSEGEGRRRIEDIKSDINALFRRAPVQFTDIRWTDDRHLLAQEIGAPITRSITFSAPEAREASESQRTSRRDAAKKASAATIDKQLRMNEVVIFDSSGGRSGGSTIEFVERVQKIMNAPDKTDEDRIEELKEKVFGNYEPAFDVVENYDRAEWASTK